MFEKCFNSVGFVNLPSSKGMYFINSFGVIRNSGGSALKSTLDDDGYSQVFADLWDGVRYYLVALPR